ncbi:MAG: tetratricopeptide repeat protein [Chloroflexi bacterium]|nr:tetratricopeptide repeat protein [Chloroflexota bacterium]
MNAQEPQSQTNGEAQLSPGVETLLQDYLQALVGDPTLAALRARYVPLHLRSLSAVSLSEEPSAEPGETDSATQPAQMGIAPADVLPRSYLWLILGEVGSGKSTLLQALTYDYASYALHPSTGEISPRLLCAERRIPLYLDLSRLMEEILEEAILATLQHYAATPSPWLPGGSLGSSKARRQILDELLGQSAFLFLVDHLERATFPNPLESIRALADFISSHPQQRLIITCRTHDYPLLEPWFGTAETAVVQPLSDREVAEYVSHALEESCAQALLQRLTIEEGWWELARNPRILGMLCSLASQRSDFEAATTANLLHQIVHRLIETAREDSPAERDQHLASVWSAAARLALEMRQQHTSLLERTLCQRLIESSPLLPQRDHPAEFSPGGSWRGREILDRLVDTGILIPARERAFLTFRSGLLGQFFAAVALKESMERGQALPTLLGDDGVQSWSEIMPLLYGMSEARAGVLEAILRPGASYADVLLAARCVVQNEPPGSYNRLVRLNPADIDLHRHFARAFEELKRLDDARAVLEDAVKLKPQRADLHQELAEVLTEQGRYTEALVQHQLAAELGGNWAQYHLGAATVRQGQGDLEQAKEELAKALEHIHQMQAEARHRLGHIYESEGYLERASAEFLAASDLRPKAHYLCHRAGIQRREGDQEEALRTLRQAIALDPECLEAHTALAELCEALGRYPEALEEFRLAIRLRPDESLNHINLGRIYQRMGDHTQAMAVVQRGLRLDPHRAEGYALLGSLYMQCDRLEEALKQYRQAIRYRPEQAEYHERAGWLLRLLGRLEEAETELSMALRLDSTQAEWQNELGVVLSEQGRYQEALAAQLAAAVLAPDEPLYRYSCGIMQAHLGQDEAAQLSFEQALYLSEQKGAPTIAADAHSELGLLHQRVGCYEEALAHHQQAVELAPLTAVYLKREAQVYRQLGKYEIAIQLLKEAISLAPEGAELHAELGLTYQDTSHPQEALSKFLLAVQLQSGEPLFSLYLGSAFQQLGRLVEAEAELQTVAQRRPELAAAPYELALVYLAQGNTQKAIASLQRALELQSDNALYHVTLGRCFRLAGWLDEALGELETAIALQSDLAEAYFELAQVFLAQGRLEAALSQATRAVELQPECGSYLRLAGSICAQLGSFAEAVHFFQATVTAEPLRPEGHHQLGQAQEALHLLEEALRSYERASELQPEAVYLFDVGRLLSHLQHWERAVGYLERAAALQPDWAEARVLLGAALRESGRPQEALPHCLRAVEIDETVGLFHRETALTYAALRQWEKASEALSKGVALDPDEAAWHNELGQAYEQMGQWLEAADSFRRAAELQPREASYWRNAANACYHLQRYPEAASQLTLALELQESALWRTELGSILESMGELERAAQEYETAFRLTPAEMSYRRKQGLLLVRLHHPQEAITILREPVTCGSADVYSLYSLGIAYQEIGLFGQSLEHYTAALQYSPQSCVLHTAIADVYGQLAVEKEDSEYHRLALEHLQKALAIDPTYAPAYDRRGAIYQRQGNGEEAIAEYQQALSLAPGEASFRCHLAGLYLHLGRVAEGLALIEEGLAEGLEAAPLYNQQGCIYEVSGEWEKALAAYERAVHLAPEVAAFRYDLARIRFCLGQEEAQTDLEQAIKLGPTPAEWHAQLGQLYESKSLWEKALSEYQEAIRGRPQQTVYLRHASRILRRLRRSSEALKMMEEALSLAPTEAANYAELGAIHLQRGDLREAMRCYAQALKIAPGQRDYELDIAIMYKLRGRYASAQERMQRIISEESTYAPAHYQLAILYEEQGLLEEALAELETALKLSREADYLYAAARVSRLLGHGDQAVTYVQTGLERFPYEAMLHYEAAHLAESESSWDKALAAYERAVALERKGVFYADMAGLLRRMNRLDEAINALKMAMSLEPGRASWHSALGELYEQCGEYTLALEEHRHAAKLEPRNALHRRNCGVVLKKLGRYQEAIEELQRALELKPDYVDAYRHLTSASASALLHRAMERRK